VAKKREERPHGIAAGLNPDAGWHSVTADAIELAAAQRANERSLAAFPYFEERYGERGRRFGLSDGAWLVTVTSLPAAEALTQIRWLGAVLSTRGMPRLLLEEHLRYLHEELGRDRKYRILGSAAGVLRKERESAIPHRAARRIAEEFDRASGGRLARFGEILTAAVADERNGIELAVSSVEAWATDPGRFPPKWIAASRAAIAAARDAR
jgi:hypothetical protein